MENINNEVSNLVAALLALDRLEAKRLLTAEPGGKDKTISQIERLMVPALEHIGHGWEKGFYALSQVYMSGRICEELVDALLLKTNTQRRDQPIMALAVLEDYHLLGKRMVYSTLRASGYDLTDYDRTDIDSLVRQSSEDGIQILLISALMLSSALLVGKVRENLERTGHRPKIIVGGAPFRIDDKLWREVGADAMCRDASEVIATITRLSRETL